MNKGEGFTITYYSKIPEAALTGVNRAADAYKESNFIVQTYTRFDADGFVGNNSSANTETAFPAPTFASAIPKLANDHADYDFPKNTGFVTGGMLREKDGSGELTVSPLEFNAGVIGDPNHHA